MGSGAPQGDESRWLTCNERDTTRFALVAPHEAVARGRSRDRKGAVLRGYVAELQKRRIKSVKN